VEAEEGAAEAEEAEEDEDEAEEEVMGGPSEDCVGVTPENSSCPWTAVGHVTSCGCTGVWSVEKLVPVIFGLVNRGKIWGHSMCSVPADILSYPPLLSPPGPVWAVRGLGLIKKSVKVAKKTRTRNKGCIGNILLLEGSPSYASPRGRRLHAIVLERCSSRLADACISACRFRWWGELFLSRGDQSSGRRTPKLRK